jgi:3-oxoacyl-[acyl-carrier-protein] synthase-3
VTSARPLVRIRSLGGYVPTRVLTNADLERLVDTTDEWIMARTGIRERRLVEPGTPTSDLATRAARHALAAADLPASALDLILVATVTPDMSFPPTACIVQENLKATNAWALDLNGACSGFVYALTTGAQLVATGAHRNVLVIGADTMSTIVDYTDRGTCILFGDGAGAAILSPSEDDTGIVAFDHECDGSGGDLVILPAGGSALPPSHATVDAKQHTIHMNGNPIFKFAVRKMAELPARILASQGLGPQDVALYVAHQANARIIEAAAQRLGLPAERVLLNIEHYGNTTAATIPLALCDAVEDDRLSHGDWVVLTSVGAGLTVGTVLMRWTETPARFENRVVAPPRGADPARPPASPAGTA